MLTLSLLVLLWQPPADAEASQGGEQVATQAQVTSYQDALGRLTTATLEVSERISPKAVAELEQAIAALEPFGQELIGDDDGREQLLAARVRLADGFTRLKSRDIARAEAVLEDVLRTTEPAQAQLAIAKAGAKLSAIADRVRSKLERRGKGTVMILCHRNCLVAIDNRPIATLTKRTQIEVYLGAYEITILSTDVPGVVQTARVELSKAGAVEGRVFGVVKSGGEASYGATTKPEPASGSKAGAGVGAAATGAVAATGEHGSAGTPEAASGSGSGAAPGHTTDSGTGSGGHRGDGVTGSEPGHSDEPGRSVDGVTGPEPGHSDEPGHSGDGVTGPEPGHSDEPGHSGDGVTGSEPGRSDEGVTEPKRMLPRWAEITGLSVGTVLIAVGPVLWTRDGDCPDASLAISECPRIWETTPAGAITLGVGAALAITSTVLLVLDEKHRGKSTDRKVLLQPNGVLRF